MRVTENRKTTIKEKSVRLDFFLKHLQDYWELAQSKYTKLKLKYHSFQENQKKFRKKIILNLFFGLESQKKIDFLRFSKNPGFRRKNMFFHGLIKNESFIMFNRYFNT